MELPRLQYLFETYGDQGFEVVAIDTHRETDLAVAFIEKKSLAYTLVEDGAGDAAVGTGIFGVLEYPTSLLIDRNGRVKYFHIGFDQGDEKKLAVEIESLL